MFAALAIVLLCSLLLYQKVSLSAQITANEGLAAHLHIRIRPFVITRRVRLLRTAQGHRLVVLNGARDVQTVAPSQMNTGRGKRILHLFRASPHARKYLVKHTQLVQLVIAARISASDAARTAFLTGCIRSAATLVPASLADRIRIMIQPDFAQRGTAAQADCIVHLRLGTILITGGLLLLSFLQRHQPGSKEAE